MIRIATEKDVPAILDIYAPYILTSTATFEYDVPCRREFMQRFLDITAQFPWLVWEENGEILGYAYASKPYARAAFSWCAEPSVYLKPEARGCGLASKLYAVLEEILRQQGYQVLYALITDENEASLRFHEKMGYQYSVKFPACGFKFNRWLGLVWMEKRLIPVITPKNFPTPFGTICQDVQSFRDILDSLSLS